VTPARWLVDKSALVRLVFPAVSEVLSARIASGLVAVSIVTELEMGFSAQSAPDYQRTRDLLVDHLLPVSLPYPAEARAREVQARLVQRGQHRAVGVPDLLLAATAELVGLTVLHYDADFDLVGDETGQPMEWVVPRGSIS
jgi:predicted nucleic acid-binding protein